VKCVGNTKFEKQQRDKERFLCVRVSETIAAPSSQLPHVIITIFLYDSEK